MTYFGKGRVLEAVGINLKFWTFAGGRVYQNKCKQEGGGPNFDRFVRT